MRNTIIYWLIIFTTIIICITFKNKYLNKYFYLGLFLCYFIIFLLLEFIDIFTPIQIWDQTERTSNCYDWFSHYLIKDYDKLNCDLSESLFFDKYDISLEQSILNKYKYFYENLNLSPGKKLLDCGSGVCTWTDYCKKRGVEVVGLTLSEEQKETCSKKGITAYVQDYRIINPEFIGNFDAISLFGSTEHICSANDFFNRERNSYDTYESLFTILKKYLKDSNGKILLTVLTYNKFPFDIYTYTQGYILERHYGGYYAKPETIEKAINNSGLNVVKIDDHTKDYHWVSIVEPDHFGHWWIHWNEDPIDKIIYFIRGLLLDPFLIHHWLYYGMDTWMWHIGGYQKTPLTDKQVENSIANLKYFIIDNK